MTTTAYQGAYFAIRLDEHGSEFIEARDNEVMIVPLTLEGDVILTSEPSPAFGEPALILPGGSIEANEAMEATATRELQEEIGYAPGRLTYLGELRPSSKYFATRSFIFLGRDLTASSLQGDEDYEILQERIPLATFEQLIATGRLTDARVIAALYIARSFLQTE
ncbi:MAG TPA: NUDIX domain-containing protein [Ktedonobacteraceae bacterium]|nr:NUDIX domain-containing protein [Ktedonobacteraceae bacterium]